MRWEIINISMVEVAVVPGSPSCRRKMTRDFDEICSVGVKLVKGKEM